MRGEERRMAEPLPLPMRGCQAPIHDCSSGTPWVRLLFACTASLYACTLAIW